jgi:hypothetical protein
MFMESRHASAINCLLDDTYDLRRQFLSLNEGHCRYDIYIAYTIEAMLLGAQARTIKLCYDRRQKNKLRSGSLFCGHCGYCATLLGDEYTDSKPNRWRPSHFLSLFCTFRSSTHASHYSNVIRVAWKRLDNLDRRYVDRMSNKRRKLRSRSMLRG